MDKDLEIGGEGLGESAARNREKRLDGEALLMLSDIERRFDLSTSEAAIRLVKVSLDRVNRREGEFAYYDYVQTQLEILEEQACLLEDIFSREAKKSLN